MDTTPYAVNRLISALALHAVVLICWVAYTFYQPVLFTNLGLEGLSHNFRYTQSMLLVAIPPIAGILADRYFANRNKTLLFFMVTIMITACIFLASAGVFMSNNSALIPLVPTFMICWIIGMNLFYNPGLSVVARSAEETGWSYASALIGSVTDLVFSTIPFLVGFFAMLGSTATFTLGGLLLIILSRFYLKYHKDTLTAHEAGTRAPFSATNALKALLIGCGLGFVHHIVLHGMEFHIEGMEHSTPLSILMALAAVLVFTLHHRIAHFGYIKTYATGFCLCLLAFAINHYLHGIAGEVLSATVFLIGIVALTATAFAAALKNSSAGWENTSVGLLIAGLNLMAIF